MRARLALVTLLVLIPCLSAPRAVADVTPQYVTLYAHGFGRTAILTALPQSNTEKAAELTNGLAFRLSPTLGVDLRILGTVTYNLYLRASGPFVGTVTAKLEELRPDGTRIVVPAAQVESPVFLNTATIPFTLGVGPAIDYQFRAGSSIILDVGITRDSGTGRTVLVWDDASAPTSVRIPAISPAKADLMYSGPHSYGRIFEAEANGTQRITINATLTDAIGVYRFSTAYLVLSAQNGTEMSVTLNPKNSTDYTTPYVVAANFNQGEWRVILTLQDSSGNGYAFGEPLWVTAFYPISIIVLDSDGSTLPYANLTVGVGTGAFWSSATNRTGWGAMMLPSTDVVGPLNLTVSWLGTRSLFPLEVTRAATVTVQLTVFATDVRITIFNLPVPLARVSLYQAGLAGQALTGADGTANLGRLPAGDYTMTVQYLLASYQTQIHLDKSGLIAVPVPFPHRTITTILAISFLALASVVLVRRRRGKFYPAGFSYFDELTHDGLPEACFTVITGNSGAGKTVLLNTLALNHLRDGSSIYVTNMEYPDRIRSDMTRLGIAQAPVDANHDRLIFVDAYSAVGGSSSNSEFAVSSHTDLTNLGLNISKALEATGGGADVYLDSLNPLVTVLRIDYMINFLQTIAARVKANNGKLCVTVGTAIDERDMTKLEQSADCVIETQLQESGSGQRRRLRIKKVRGKPYDDHWTRFRVEEGKGIIFLTRKKPTNHQTNN
jgi:KaiC/GvpD/RAD55 family RecA-like ATPase